MTPQTRSAANLAALAELLKPDPDPDVLAHSALNIPLAIRNHAARLGS